MLGVSNKTDRMAIIIPGFLSGLILAAIIFASDVYVMLGTRADRFSFVAFIVAPVVLAAAGSVSVIIRHRKERRGPSPWSLYLTGFIGTITAISLMLALGAMTQYVPSMDPGLFPRLSFIFGYLLFCLPLVVPVSAIFAFFSLAGGVLMHGKLEPENMDGDKKRAV